MSDSTPQKPGDFKLTDPVQLAQNLARVFEHAAQIARQIAERPELAKKQAETQVTPIDQVTKTLGAVAQAYLAEPQKLMEAQTQLWNSYSQLWQNAWSKALGTPTEPWPARRAMTSASRTRTGRKTRFLIFSSSST